MVMGVSLVGMGISLVSIGISLMVIGVSLVSIGVSLMVIGVSLMSIGAVPLSIRKIRFVKLVSWVVFSIRSVPLVLEKSFPCLVPCGVCP